MKTNKRIYKVFLKMNDKIPYLTKCGRNNHSEFLKMIKVGLYTNFHIKGRTIPINKTIYRVKN